MRDGKPGSKVKSEKYNAPSIQTGPSYKPLRLALAPGMAVAVSVPEGAIPQTPPELEVEELELLDVELVLDDELLLELEDEELELLDEEQFDTTPPSPH